MNTETKQSLSTSVTHEVAEKIVNVARKYKTTRSRVIYILLLIGLDHLEQFSEYIDTN